MKSKIFLAIFFLLFFSGCKKEDQQPPDLKEVYIVDIASETDWDYWVIGTNGDNFLVKEENGKIAGIILYSGDGKQAYPVFFDENGRPDKVVVEDNIYLFRNYNGNLVDIAVMTSQGEAVVARKVETDFNWDNLYLKSARYDKTEFLLMVGHVVKAIPCAVSVAGTFATAGAATPLTVGLMAWTCGNMLNDLFVDAAKEADYTNSLVDFSRKLQHITKPVSIAKEINTGLSPDVILSILSSVAGDLIIDYAHKKESIEEIIEQIDKTEELLISKGGDGIFVDNRDSKTYKWVKIGEQVWMAENLAFNTTVGNRYVYNFNSNNIKTYGMLYNWEAAKSACPDGWHLPSNIEWKKLIEYLGGTDVAGGKMKALIHWTQPNTGATNASGFSALPSGYFSPNNSPYFYNMGRLTFFWSSTKADDVMGYQMAFARQLDHISAAVSNDNNTMATVFGISVRCVKD
jgi:uncharacterized protein (TIGR02145 family)